MAATELANTDRQSPIYLSHPGARRASHGKSESHTFSWNGDEERILRQERHRAECQQET